MFILSDLFVSSSILPLFRPVSKSLQVQSRHTLQVQDETLGLLRCCFGQDMSSSMRGCTAVWAQEGKEILVHVAEPSHSRSFPQGVQWRIKTPASTHPASSKTMFALV